MSTIVRVAALGTLACLVVGPAPAQAGPWLLSPKEFYSQFLAGASRTNDWFDAGGHRAPLAYGGHASEYSMTSYNEFGWRKGVNVVFAVPFKSVNYRQDASGFDGTHSGIQDVTVGLRYGLVTGRTPVALQADWRAAAGYNPRLTPRLGDGSQDVDGQLFLGGSVPALRGFLQAAGGYRVRFDMPADTVATGSNPVERAVFDEGRAQEVFFSADAGFWIMQPLLLAGNVSWLSQSGRGTTQRTLEAGPRLIFRVDDALDLVLVSTHTLAGENAQKSNQVFLGLAFKGTKLTRYQGYLGNAEER